MAELSVVAKLKSKPGLEERVRLELLKLVEETHKEPGCIKYDLHCSIENPGEFVFYEIWKSKEDLDRHLSAPHLVRFSSLKDELLAEVPEIRLYELISEPKALRVEFPC